MVIIVYDGERLSSNWRLMSVHLVTDQLIATDHSVHCGYLSKFGVIMCVYTCMISCQQDIMIIESFQPFVLVMAVLEIVADDMSCRNIAVYHGIHGM